MTDTVWVIQEEPTGQWVAECLDDRCEDSVYANGPHRLAYTPRKSVADAAATRHRRLLRTFPVHEETRRTDICGNCGQSERANSELRRLVGDLEARLAHHEEAQDAS